MFKKVKKLVACGLSCAMIVGATNMPVLAATSVTGNVAGTEVSGVLTVSSSSASANTVFIRGGGTRYVSVCIQYKGGTKKYQSSASASTGNTGGISATATKQVSGATVTGAGASHRLEYSPYTWGPVSTSWGTIFVPDAFL